MIRGTHPAVIHTNASAYVSSFNALAKTKTIEKYTDAVDSNQ